MNALERHEMDRADRAVAADRSADFIFKFALGVPKTLATVKAASDHFDRSAYPPMIAPPLAPIMDSLVIEDAFSQV